MSAKYANVEFDTLLKFVKNNEVSLNDSIVKVASPEKEMHKLYINI